MIAEWWCYTSTQREITIGSTCEDERELSLAKALEAGIKSAPEDVLFHKIPAPYRARVKLRTILIRSCADR